MNKINMFHPVPAPQPPVSRKDTPVRRTELGMDFQEVLRQQTNSAGIKFSSHCIKRLEQNNIQFSPQQLDKLTGAVNRAELKGARESCIVMDDMAFIVSINNKTIITVVDGPRMKDSVFTNIDSAVII